MLTAALRKVHEYSFYLQTLFIFKLSDIVVEIDDLERLDEDCRTGLGLIVDHSRELCTVGSLDRYAVTTISGCDDRILKHVSVRFRMDDLVQLLSDTII